MPSLTNSEWPLRAHPGRCNCNVQDKVYKKKKPSEINLAWKISSCYINPYIHTD
ncbi:unnamed protein product [Clavelina lepadiformis]|uniref:Uncharacterized protein n=1 Tax=Clavelina lepadiformis TaxID=159417 RepID=A0ABP0FN98_CLALP